MAQSALPAETVERIRALHGEGRSASAIGRELHCSTATVTKYAKRLGLSFDRSQTAAATAAHVADLRALRVQLAQDLLADATRLRAQLWEPHMAFAFGGKDNTYEEHQIPEPTAQDKRHLIQAAATAIDRSLKLVEFDHDTTSSEGAAAILDFASKLRAAPEPDAGAV